MTIKKSIRHKSPYIPKTFNDHLNGIVKKNGLISGSYIRQTSTSELTLGPYEFIQGGVLISSDEDETVSIPALSDPGQRLLVLTATSEDLREETGVVYGFTEGKNLNETTVVLGFAPSFDPAEATNTWIVPGSSLTIKDLDNKRKDEVVAGVIGGIEVTADESDITVNAGIANSIAGDKIPNESKVFTPQTRDYDWFRRDIVAHVPGVTNPELSSIDVLRGNTYHAEKKGLYGIDKPVSLTGYYF